MIAMTLIVCLNSQPAECRPEPVAFQGSVMQCALFGGHVAAEWVGTHPKWFVSKWRCGERPGQDA